ncbi:diaminopropionate ammonia-lyase [Iamia sp. SCSIO 61187]|uniref:diaminopropionate ammonia-lyase n=1 Tax=Iamia sp. SCSIO 61187 TaxID=2722752 RepID=UPI001C6332C0|nr:diaminopropionate ammonia-lyase [Iamia sp. SCSIO 61187]QYG93157.1 diaminopropionate ammonia-lyase [Iamia sp. SCSIO 61187]
MTSEILRNPGRGPLPADARDGGPSPQDFHRRLPGYAPTPLVDAAPLAADLGVGRLWVKDESWRLGLPAFKMLGASWASYRLLVSRLGAEPSWATLDELAAALVPLGPLTLVAATDGNHGRAVARTARLLGLGAHVLVPAGTADARIEAIASEGARVDVVDGTYDDAIAASAALASDDHLVVSDTSWPGYAEVPRWVIDGYATIFAEVDEQLAATGAPPPDVVVAQMGVGALAAATVGHVRSTGGDRPTIVVVEPLSAACGLRSAEAGHPVEVPGPHRSIMAGLNCGMVSELAWPTVAAGTDWFVAVSDAAAEQAMRDLATVGVTAGETGGAGLAGLRQLVASGEADIGPDSSVLVLNTEGPTDPGAYERITGIAVEGC